MSHSSNSDIRDQPAGSDGSPSRRVLLIAYAAHPDTNMESRVGWHRALQAARRHDTWVLYGEDHPVEELADRAAAEGVSKSLHFVKVPHGMWGGLLTRNARLFWQGYALWQKQVLRVAEQLHQQIHFDLVHQVSFCGYREPGYCWKLPPPFVIGPVGGTHNFPISFLGQIDLPGRIREVVRNVVNSCQIRSRRRVKHAFRRAAAVLTANSAAQEDLQNVLGVDSIRQLETGIDDRQSFDRPEREPDAPLRILWAGRCCSWKALPLLLKALAILPTDFRYELRVLGSGPCRHSWQRLATQLGIDHSIEWIEWPTYDETLSHYCWADVFAFTSLRDTSGTGLLEALAAGAPIVGVDHQGAADIMTGDCAIPVAVGKPQQTIAEFASALERLVREPGLLMRLSEGARHRAPYYLWDRQGERMDAVYRSVFNTARETRSDFGPPSNSKISDVAASFAAKRAKYESVVLVND